MKKTLVLATGAAIATFTAAVSAKPLALFGLGTLVMSVWALTFPETYNSDSES